jgi:hypothetical protein
MSEHAMEPKPTKLPFVIAGNHNEYLDYLARYKLTEKDAAFLESPGQLRGYSGIQFVLWGTYLDRKDIGEIQRRIGILNRPFNMPFIDGIPEKPAKEAPKKQRGKKGKP